MLKGATTGIRHIVLSDFFTISVLQEATLPRGIAVFQTNRVAIKFFLGLCNSRVAVLISNISCFILNIPGALLSLTVRESPLGLYFQRDAPIRFVTFLKLNGPDMDTVLRIRFNVIGALTSQEREGCAIRSVCASEAKWD